MQNAECKMQNAECKMQQNATKCNKMQNAKCHKPARDFLLIDLRILSARQSKSDTQQKHIVGLVNDLMSLW